MRDASQQNRDPAAARALRAWYDGAARDLPWRLSPAALAAGGRPDPYRVWLSEVMLQQTTVAAVRGYFARFTALWPDVGALAAAQDAQVMAEWAGLGYYARARNLLACARQVAGPLAGVFPGDEAGLRALPGVGAYTAAAVAAIAFDQPAVVVDANVERVVARFFALRDPLPGARAPLRALAARLTPAYRPGCHAQAMMDLGATICTPRKPRCDLCPLAQDCQALALGLAESLPAKSPKHAKPLREGLAYVARRAGDGGVLLETRPPRGLLGGMPAFPGSAWDRSDWQDQPAPSPPLQADWHEAGAVRHSFTHFDLQLRVLMADDLPADCLPARGAFVADFQPKALPTLMRKVWARASGL